MQIDFLTPYTKIYRLSKEPEISEYGLLLSSTFKDYEFENYTNFREELDLLKYDEYNTLLPLSWSEPSFS